MAFFDKMLNAMRLNSDEDDDEFYNDEYLSLFYHICKKMSCLY